MTPTPFNVQGPRGFLVGGAMVSLASRAQPAPVTFDVEGSPSTVSNVTRGSCTLIATANGGTSQN